MASVPGRKVIPFYALKLRFMMKPRAHFWVECWSCKHREALDIMSLIARFGMETTMVELQKKTFRCKRCGSTTVSTNVEWLEDAPRLSTDF